MLYTVQVGECMRDITTWSLSVAMDRAFPEDAVEGLETFRRKHNGWSKPTNILWKVNKKVKLGLR
jgi:hypothetical protein